ncbi:MAG: hypothetical protein Q4B18_06955 [Bacillota bacterium]|nr:hypothetical protein [Bacillota bacterium]
MEIYKNYLEDFMYIHSDMKSRYIKELKSLPKGKLIGYITNGNQQYYRSQVTNDGTYMRRGIGKDDHMKAQLARREYLQRVIPMLNHNIKILEHAYTHYQTITPDNVISNMSTVYRSLPKQYFTDKSILPERLQQWMDEPFDQSTYKPEEKIHKTSRNLKVRTRAEVIIAEALYSYNIAFRYEQRLYIRNRRYAPDFTIKLPDGRLYYWEHAGKTHDKNYMYDHYDKLISYLYAGIVPGENLILTYDSIDGEFDSEAVHFEIKNKLLSP